MSYSNATKLSLSIKSSSPEHWFRDSWWSAILESKVCCQRKDIPNSPARAFAGNSSLYSLISRPTQLWFPGNNRDPDAGTSSANIHLNRLLLSKKSIKKKRTMVNNKFEHLEPASNLPKRWLIAINFAQ